MTPATVAMAVAWSPTAPRTLMGGTPGGASWYDSPLRAQKAPTS